MDGFLRYLKDRIVYILFFSGCIMIFTAIFALYHLPLKAVLYPSSICIIIAATLVTLGYHRFNKKHKQLRELSGLPENMMSILEDYESAEEEDFKSIIEALGTLCFQIQTAKDSQISDMIDYYTTWAHQIKTPIASMRLTLQEQDSVSARKLSEELSRIEQYVEMVLCYIRLDSNTTDYTFHTYDIDDIIRQAIHKYAGQFISRGLSLEYEPLGIKLVTDEKWLVFVIEQLITNAIKYTDKGRVSIYLEEGHFLCIRDTGMGISPEDLPRIFEKGFTGLNGRADKKASGLGLYLCSCICSNLGLDIFAESKTDEYTIIRIDLKQKKCIPE